MDSKTAAIAGAIIVAGALVAGAVLYSLNKPQNNTEEARAFSVEKLRLPNASDHRLGPATAKVAIVTFTDLECPYCKVWHETVLELAKKYPTDLQIIYRHFPIARHTKASTEAQATECAAKLAGENAFWSMVTEIFKITPSNDGLDLSKLPQLAQKAGVKDLATFTTCVETGETKERVDRDLAEATATGGRGTPWSIFITKSGNRIPIPGAQELAPMIQAVEAALREE